MRDKSLPLRGSGFGSVSLICAGRGRTVLTVSPLATYCREKMRTNLNVPYAEKEEAKRLGARWDIALKIWYVQDLDDLGAFMKWMPDQVKNLTSSGKKRPGHGFPTDLLPTPAKDGPVTFRGYRHCGCYLEPMQSCRHM